jgi:signal transduction histidine kinase
VILGASLTSDGQFRFSVRDFGIGISQEDQIELFHFNPKIGKAGTEGEPSSGLGLYLCKEFITFHQGHMFVSSEAGSGAMLGFVMPLNNNSPA